MVESSAISRPLRALALVLCGWIAMRVVILWPTGSTAKSTPSDAGTMPTASPMVAVAFGVQVPALPRRRPIPGNIGMNEANPIKVKPDLRSSLSTNRPDSYVTAQLYAAAPEQAETSSDAFRLPPVARVPMVPQRDRLSASAWSIMRGDNTQGLASGGQLGGSQAGVRFFYTPGPEAVALTARLSTPLAQSKGREAAIGIALRGRNVGVIAEERFALDKGGRSAPAIIVYGGISEVKLPGRFRLDSYAQAGVVGIATPAAFIDGAVRIERSILTVSGSSLAYGVGAWGGAQPGANRLDVGPQIVAHVAAARTSLRVSAEWRERVAGNASPASGPSVTVGIDF